MDTKCRGLRAGDGTGPRGVHSWGRCASNSPQVPGPPVITSTNRQSDDALPGGRPRSWSNDSKDEKPQGLGTYKQLQAVDVDDAEPDEDGGSEAGKQSQAKVMGPRSITEAGEARCTSVVNKCKGKYRIKIKGASCHGRACCRRN